MAAAFIASRVDYCNGVLYGISSQVIHRLQMVLNAAARLVVGVGRYEHITPALRDVLLWLPVPQRMQFKIAISAFDCVREHPLPTLTTSASQSLASLAGHIFVWLNAVPSTQFGRRSFHVASQQSGTRFHHIAHHP